MGENAMLFVAVAGFLLNFVGTLIAGVWKLSQLEVRLRGDISKARDEIEMRQDQHSREFGETIAALRQKVADVELYAANNYVRRDGFYKVQEQLTADIKALGLEIKGRLERMEAKIDDGKG